MSEPGEGSRKIKVVDRRRFDVSGDERVDMPPLERKPESASTSAQTGEDRGAEAVRPAPEASPGIATSSLFLDLIAGLAQQAEILITGGQGIAAQPAEAQRVIEYLSMLESKTAGNLSAEEKHFLSQAIFQLRSAFVGRAP